MSCKYLQQLRIPNCQASARLMSPSVFEQLVFCRSDYWKCPVFQETQTMMPAKKEMALAVEMAQALGRPATEEN